MIDVDGLFRSHGEELVWALRRRFPRVPFALVEDACAEAWAIAWRHRERLEDDTGIGWLFVVAQHEVSRLAKKRGRELLDGGGHAGVLYAREGDPELALELREALRAVDRLSPSQRRAIALRAAGFRYEEIQAIEDKTYTWVNRHLTEGTRALRAALADDQGGENAPPGA